MRTYIESSRPRRPSSALRLCFLYARACVCVLGVRTGGVCFVLMSSNENTATGRHATGARMAVLLFTFLRLAHYCRFLIKNNGSG
jgi:hypothetical protein